MVVDSAHGHSANVIETVRSIKKQWDIDVVAGNVATADGCKDLIAAGADAVKVGIGPGSICTTRVISGVGVPQITAIYAGRPGCREEPNPRHRRRRHPLLRRHDQGDCRRGARGDDRRTVRRIAGKPRRTNPLSRDERSRFIEEWAPWGPWFTAPASATGKAAHRGPDKLVPEGVEGRVPFKGPLGPFVYQLVGGLRAGMGYCGTRTIEELRTECAIHPSHTSQCTGESSS